MAMFTLLGLYVMVCSCARDRSLSSSAMLQLHTTDSSRRTATSAAAVAVLTKSSAGREVRQSTGPTSSPALPTATKPSHLQRGEDSGPQPEKQPLATRGEEKHTPDKRMKNQTHNSPSVLVVCVNQSGDCCVECGSASSTPSDLQGPSGRIEWAGNGSKAVCVWTISATSPMAEALGLVLHFVEVGLQRGWTENEDDTVMVYQGPEPLENLRQGRVRGSLPVSPILLRSDRAVVRLEAKSARHGSRFALSYTAYPLDKLPPAAGRLGPLLRYNCSPPYFVPEALRCDMVEQCVDGQDESDYNCTCPTCAGFYRIGAFLYKFFFPGEKVSPLEARGRCARALYFGELHDDETKQQAAHVTSVSGHTHLIVNLVRFGKKVLREQSLYRFLWRWQCANQLEPEGPLPHAGQGFEECAVLKTEPTVHFQSVRCWKEIQAGYACMSYVGYPNSSEFRRSKVEIMEPSVSVSTVVQNYNLHVCSDGSVTQAFHSCPRELSTTTDRGHEDPLFRPLLCTNEQKVRYTLVSDGRDDCGDDSDEFRSDYFVHSKNQGFESFFLCKDKENPIASELRCNGQFECFDDSDEENCYTCTGGMTLYPVLGCLPDRYITYGLDRYYIDESIVRQQKDRLARNFTFEEPGLGLKVLHMDGYGMATVDMSTASQCPLGYLLCSPYMCIPSYLVDNGIGDCLYSYRETRPSNNCSGLYRCYETRMCLDPVHLCDGIIHCPNKDDELYCNITCPSSCVCEGFEYKCRQMFDPVRHPVVRYLDLSGVYQPSFQQIVSLTFLGFLNMSSCGLTSIDSSKMYHLIVLDLSHNHLTTFHDISVLTMVHLRHLYLSGNPLFTHLNQESFLAPNSHMYMRPVLSLDLSNTGVTQIDSGAFVSFKKLVYLDLSHNAVEEFAGDTFNGLDNLGTLVADDRRLCCLYQRKSGRPVMCTAPVDELSSCSDLLRFPFLRITLWLQAGMALVGNGGVFVSRVFFDSLSQSSGFRVLVINLSVADLLMGLYLILVGSADARFSGQYLWARRSWVHSSQCQAAGFMSLLSSEVSVFIICLITLDRFLVFRFPFSHHLHLTSRSASVMCSVAWAVGVLLAAIPLLPVTQHWQFYSQTGICLPLPVTRHQFPGQHYSVSIFIILNFVLFLLIAAGQLAIYQSIHSSTAASLSRRRQQDTAIARRLFFIVFTDFCCWFPVGIMGFLATRGIAIPGEVNVWAAVFVLPLNSALNPFLYTLNNLRERRREVRDKERARIMLDRLHVDILTWPKERVLQCHQIVAQQLAREGEEVGGVTFPRDHEEHVERAN